MVSVVHQPVQHSSFNNLLQGPQSSPQHRVSLLYQFVQFLCCFSDAAAPADAAKQDVLRLVEDMQHFGADTEGPTFPYEVQSVLSFLGDGLSKLIIFNIINHTPQQLV